jgi:hypothetical protein
MKNGSEMISDAMMSMMGSAILKLADDSKPQRHTYT